MMKCHLLYHFVEEIRRFLDISFIDASVYKESNVHIKMHSEGCLRGKLNVSSRQLS